MRWLCAVGCGGLECLVVFGWLGVFWGVGGSLFLSVCCVWLVVFDVWVWLSFGCVGVFLFLCEFLCGCVGVFLVFVYVSLVRLYVGGIWLSF